MNRMIEIKTPEQAEKINLLASKVLMLSWAVMISLCHAVVRLPRPLSWNIPFDGADIRPIMKGLSSYIHAPPAL